MKSIFLFIVFLSFSSFLNGIPMKSGMGGYPNETRTTFKTGVSQRVPILTPTSPIQPLKLTKVTFANHPDIQIIEREEKNPEALYRNSFELSEIAFQKSLAVPDQEESILYQHKAQLLCGDEKKPGAAFCYQQAASIYEDHYDAAQLFLRAGHLYERAAEELQRAIENQDYREYFLAVKLLQKKKYALSYYEAANSRFLEDITKNKSQIRLRTLSDQRETVSPMKPPFISPGTQQLHSPIIPEEKIAELGEKKEETFRRLKSAGTIPNRKEGELTVDVQSMISNYENRIQKNALAPQKITYSKTSPTSPTSPNLNDSLINTTPQKKPLNPIRWLRKRWNRYFG